MMSDSPASRARGRNAARLLVLGIIVAVGLAARLVPWHETFTPEGVRFRGDSDPYYHALRARRILVEWPRLPWRDPYMDYPQGADILWPPLFDAVIAGAARLVGATADRPERLAEAAALVPVLFGLALLPTVAVLARALLGGRAGILSALLVALLPASLRFSSVGTADHHVAELLFATLMVYGFVGTWSDGASAAPRRATGLLVGATVLAFWNWQGSALALFPLVLWAGVWHVVAPPGDSTSRRALHGLAWGSAGATAVLAATVAAWGPPGAFSRPSLSGIGVTHVAACAISALFGGTLAAAGRWCGNHGRMRRVGEVAVAAIVPVAASLLIPPIRGGVGHGMTALGAANPWFRTIDEFRPLFQGAASVAEIVVMSMAGFGACLLVVPAAAVALLHRWQRDPARHPNIAFLALWGGLFLLLALARKRFVLYLVVPLALWCEVAVREAAQVASRRWAAHAALVRRAVTVAGTFLLVAPALPMVWMAGHVASDPLQDEVLIPLAQELRTMVAPPDRPAVMAPWSAGHVIHYFAEKPVVVTPFGTDLGPEGMRDLARFQFSNEPAEVEEILSRRRVGFVLIQAPAIEGRAMLDFLPPDGSHAFGLVRDDRRRPLHTAPGYARMVRSRLYHFDGMARSSEPLATLESYRLLAESSGSALDFGSDLPGPPYKVFGVVPGVQLIVQDLSAGPVFVTARVVTNRGRSFDWTTNARADEKGNGRLRLPYATGVNGLSRAGPYLVFQPGRGSRTLKVTEEQVLLGDQMQIAIPR